MSRMEGSLFPAPCRTPPLSVGRHDEREGRAVAGSSIPVQICHLRPSSSMHVEALGNVGAWAASGRGAIDWDGAFPTQLRGRERPPPPVPVGPPAVDHSRRALSVHDRRCKQCSDDRWGRAGAVARQGLSRGDSRPTTPSSGRARLDGWPTRVPAPHWPADWRRASLASGTDR